MSKFDALTLDVNRPHRVLLLKPDGSPWKDKDGNQAWIEALSPDSDKGAEADRTINDRAMEAGSLSREEAMRARLPYLTTGWYLLDFNGNVVSDTYSIDAAEELYGGRGRDFIARQVIVEIFDTANFMPAPPSA